MGGWPRGASGGGGTLNKLPSPSRQYIPASPPPRIAALEVYSEKGLDGCGVGAACIPAGVLLPHSRSRPSLLAETRGANYIRSLGG